MRNKLKYALSLVALLLLFSVQPVFAAGPPSPSLLSNPLAIILIVLMILLVIIIGVLANILIGAAEIKLKKKKAKDSGMITGVMVLLFMLIAPSVMAQNETTPVVETTVKSIGGIESSAFYLMTVILFLELLVILVLLVNIKLLIKTEKEKLIPEKAVEETRIAKANQLSWWDRFNKLRPVSQEAELDLGHDYDGIRELNNRLPPWWLYGFYITIVFAVIYLWRFHVSHTGLSSKQEYERSVADAEIRVNEYLKKKGESIDENTVALLTSADDISAGKAIFTDPSKCTACHGSDGGGNVVGPNLTDNYWLYGGGIKDLFKTIKYGTSKGMRSWKDDLSPKQIAQVASYVKSLHGTKPANPKDPQGELYKEETAPMKATMDTAKAAISKMQP